MKLKDHNSIYDVIARIEDKKVIYFVICKFGNLHLIFDEELCKENNCDVDKAEIYGKPITENLLGKTFYEIEYLDKEALYKIYAKDFASEQEKEKYSKLEKQLYLDYTNYLRKEIKKDYYKEKIEKNELEIWKNNFEDKVYKINDREYYIDDNEFDIFYDTDEKRSYNFKFIEK